MTVSRTDCLMAESERIARASENMDTYLSQLQIAARQGRWGDVEQIARQWLSKRPYFVPHLFLIHALLRTRRDSEADREFEALLSYKHNLAERISAFPLVEARYRGKLSTHYVDSTLGGGRFLGHSGGRGVARWKMPALLKDKQSFLKEAGDLISATVHPGNKTAAAEAEIYTFGSCFAANIARALVDRNMTASCLFIEESVNSTTANRVLLDCMVGEVKTDAHRAMTECFGLGFLEQTADKLKDATHVILTVGVAPSFFNVEDGSYCFSQNYLRLLSKGKVSMRTATCAETIENLTAILGHLQSLAPKAQTIITVSPVPLEGSVEMPSAVLADCVSKSVLRSAVHELLLAEPELVYFPSFEIVRWLSGHTSAQIFGSDDENSRHVSGWVIDFIARSFMNLFFENIEGPEILLVDNR